MVDSLYLHAPFCTRKCGYCHFYVVRDAEQLKDLWLEGILLELQLRGVVGPLTTLYFGGGTPSLLGPERIGKILERLPLAPDCEVTLEANPETFDTTGLDGINRVSFGVQSFDDATLQRLERRHTADQALRAIESAAPIGNISIDLMYDVPSLTLDTWQQTLDQAIALPIQHLSLYNLTIEPGTKFHRHRLRMAFPNEEESLQMHQMAIETLQKGGFERYEISAFARDGKVSRHNSGYWLGRPFLGLGPSAFSDLHGRRFRNIPNLIEWHRRLARGEDPLDYEEQLDPEARAAELLAIGLRRTEGVPLTRSAEIDQLLSEGLLQATEDRLRLTEQGTLFYDTVASHLVIAE